MHRRGLEAEEGRDLGGERRAGSGPWGRGCAVSSGPSTPTRTGAALQWRVVAGARVAAGSTTPPSVGGGRCSRAAAEQLGDQLGRARGQPYGLHLRRRAAARSACRASSTSRCQRVPGTCRPRPRRSPASPMRSARRSRSASSPSGTEPSDGVLPGGPRAGGPAGRSARPGVAVGTARLEARRAAGPGRRPACSRSPARSASTARQPVAVHPLVVGPRRGRELDGERGDHLGATAAPARSPRPTPPTDSRSTSTSGPSTSRPRQTSPGYGAWPSSGRLRGRRGRAARGGRRRPGSTAPGRRCAAGASDRSIGVVVDGHREDRRQLPSARCGRWRSGRAARGRRRAARSASAPTRSATSASSASGRGVARRGGGGARRRARRAGRPRAGRRRCRSRARCESVVGAVGGDADRRGRPPARRPGRRGSASGPAGAVDGGARRGAAATRSTPVASSGITSTQPGWISRPSTSSPPSGCGPVLVEVEDLVPAAAVAEVLLGDVPEVVVVVTGRRLDDVDLLADHVGHVLGHPGVAGRAGCPARPRCAALCSMPHVGALHVLVGAGGAAPASCCTALEVASPESGGAVLAAAAPGLPSERAADEQGADQGPGELLGGPDERHRPGQPGTADQADRLDHGCRPRTAARPATPRPAAPPARRRWSSGWVRSSRAGRPWGTAAGR